MREESTIPEPSKLLDSERIDDLTAAGLRIIQSSEVFSFSMDAVLLSRFAGIPRYGRIVDLCSGNGVIPLLLTTRTKAKIDAVEIQPRLADMAVRSVALNGLEERIAVYEADLRTYHEKSGYGVYDAVTVNPPYMPVGGSDRNRNPYIAAARHELYCTLDDVAAACARLVRTGGKVSMVHRPNRLTDIIAAFRKVKLEPKRIRFVHPQANAEANMVLIEAMRDAKPDVKLLPPLIVYKDKMMYSDEILHIYNRSDTISAGDGGMM